MKPKFLLLISLGALFVAFTALIYTMPKGFMTPFGAMYLLSLGLACGVVIRMRRTIELASRSPEPSREAVAA